MRRKIDYIFTTFLIILGICHTALTPMFYKIFDLNALWFAGTGLAFMFLGLFNVSRLKTTEKFIKILCSVGNALAFIFCILIVMQLTQPQAFICLFTLFVLLGLSLIDFRLSEKHL